MDWNDLQYVLALTRAGSLSAAAAHLGVVRTTVGRRVRGLESDLGVRLFDQTPEGFVLTLAGQELVATAERLEEELLLTRGRLMGRDADLKGRLRVSMLGFIYEGFVDVFASFTQRYPGIDLTVSATVREVSLLRREADVVLRLNNNPTDRLVGRRLGTMQFAPYASKALVERVGENAPLGAFPWIHSDERVDGRWLDTWISVNAPGAQVALRTEDYTVIRTSVAAGIGVHFLPCFEGDADENLLCIGPRLMEQSRVLWLLTLPELRTNSRVRVFMDHVQEAFKSRQDEMAGNPTL